jgi:uncharacterized damage-inducible protein DinB
MTKLKNADVLTGAEKDILQVSMDRHRAAILWKIAGLTEEQLRTALVPSGTTLLGLIKHLGAVEYGWFCESFGVATEPLPFDDEDEEADLRIEEGESAESVLAFYERACAASDRVIAANELDLVGRTYGGEPVSLRWVLVHMIEETARHAGHIDILRELIDGKTGDHDRS